MSARSFVDTNILLYADSPAEPEKQSIALALIAEQLRLGSGVISMQVLHEFAAAGLKKLDLADSLVQSRIDLYSRFEIVMPGVGALKEALALRVMYTLSFWDALIIQAAHDGGCTRLLSEDLATGSTIGGVLIVNPFDGQTSIGLGAR